MLQETRPPISMSFSSRNLKMHIVWLENTFASVQMYFMYRWCPYNAFPETKMPLDTTKQIFFKNFNFDLVSVLLPWILRNLEMELAFFLPHYIPLLSVLLVLFFRRMMTISPYSLEFTSLSSCFISMFIVHSLIHVNVALYL